MLPLDDNGLPIECSFVANSFSAMEDMFCRNLIAKYTFMSTWHNIPPICLGFLDSDNKISA